MNYILFYNNINMYFFRRFIFVFNYLKRLRNWFNEIFVIYIEVKDMYCFVFEFSLILFFIGNVVFLN